MRVVTAAVLVVLAFSSGCRNNRVVRGVSDASGRSAAALSQDQSLMVEVPAGSFLRGSRAGEGADDERPQKRIHLDGFHIDQHEVTVAQYRKCVLAGGCTAPDAGMYCNWGESDREDHPVNYVEWEQARKYCKWAGKRLPTEAEWEKAARGTDGRTYPWGSEAASCERAVMIKGVDGCGKDRTWPVGSKSPKGDSPYGAQDMAGNVREWVSDWYGEDYYASSPERNPQGPSSGDERVVRGGSWVNDDARAACRDSFTPTNRNGSVGFRCVRTVQP